MYRVLRAGICGIFYPLQESPVFLLPLTFSGSSNPSPASPVLAGSSYVQPSPVYAQHSVPESPGFSPPPQSLAGPFVPESPVFLLPPTLSGIFCVNRFCMHLVLHGGSPVLLFPSVLSRYAPGTPWWNLRCFYVWRIPGILAFGFFWYVPGDGCEYFLMFSMWLRHPSCPSWHSGLSGDILCIPVGRVAGLLCGGAACAAC